MTYTPRTQAERSFMSTVYRSRRGNKRRKKQTQCGYSDHWQCKHVDERQRIVRKMHDSEIRAWWP